MEPLDLDFLIGGVRIDTLDDDGGQPLLGPALPGADPVAVDLVLLRQLGQRLVAD